MYALLIALHVLSCLVLIMVILLQAGKGGGISETFGGSGGLQQMLGTKASSFLTKATALCAVLFLTTSMSLALMSINKGGSIVEKEMSKQEKTAPVTPATPPQSKVDTTGQQAPDK